MSMVAEAYLGIPPDGTVGPYIGVFLWQVSSFEHTETTGLIDRDGTPISGFEVVSPGKPWMKVLLQPLAGGDVGVRYGFVEEVVPGLSWNNQGLLIPETIELLKCKFRPFRRMADLPAEICASCFLVARDRKMWAFGRCFKMDEPGQWVALPPEVELSVDTDYGHCNIHMA